MYTCTVITYRAMGVKCSNPPTIRPAGTRESLVVRLVEPRGSHRVGPACRGSPPARPPWLHPTPQPPQLPVVSVWTPHMRVAWAVARTCACMWTHVELEPPSHGRATRPAISPRRSRPTIRAGLYKTFPWRTSTAHKPSQLIYSQLRRTTCKF